MTSATTAGPSYVETIALALEVFGGLRPSDENSIRMEARSFHGIGLENLAIRPSQAASGTVPLPLLQRLDSNWSVELAPFSVTVGSVPHEFPMLFCLWTPTTRFGRPPDNPKGAHTHYVLPEAAERIRAAFASAPPPSLLVDAAHEVWAGWRLAKPVRASLALPALRALASRMGADELPADISELRLPFAGMVRNWNVVSPESIRILIAEPNRTYALEDVLHVAKINS